MEVSFLFEQFIAYIVHIRNYSPATISGYRSTFRQFIRENKLEGAKLNTINQFTVENWLMEWRINKKWMANTFIWHHKHLNCFYEWMKKKWIVPENFIKSIEKPRLEQRIPRRLSLDQSEKLLQAIRSSRYKYTFEKQKSLAIISLMLFGWLRKSEVLNLKIYNVDMDKSIIHIIQGKWKKDRLVPMCSHLRTILDGYIKERQRLWKTSEFFINPSQQDNQSWQKSIARIIDKLKAKTKLDFSAHSLRHTFATLMLEWWCDIYTLSKIMWHSKITTTTIYLTCSEKLLLSSIEKHPLN